MYKRKIYPTSRRAALALAICVGVTSWMLGDAQAQQPPIKVGASMAQTGPLGAAGRSSLLALRMWAEDVNAKGGLLGRKVEVIAYDDQANPSLAPSIYAKLLDLDKVDLLIAPYGTVPAAAIMPMAKERRLLLIGNIAYQANLKVKHDMWFNNSPWSDAESWVGGYFKLGQSVGVRTVAFLASDQEFAQNILAGAKELAKKANFKTVYEQSYPPPTVDFSSMIRAIRAADPDMVFVASYPGDSAAIVRAVREIGLGPSLKLFGGGMVGLQYASLMESLGSALNGIVNYNTYVPEKTLDFPGVRDFLARYAQRAVEAKVETLGYYVAPFTYAAAQLLEQAVAATKSLDHKVLAEYLRKNEMKTIVGPIRYGPDGEWANPRVVMTQFRGVVDKNVDQFRQPGKQVILYPAEFKTGGLIAPFEKAQKQKE
jgi:branched-chain amino acid transport system substrate-binding protein